jgi:hypothetical protein
VGEHLGSIAGAIGAEGFEPLGGLAVDLAASQARDLVVGDVADEDVPEAVLGLALDRRIRRALQELAFLEVAQSSGDPSPWTAGDGR